MSIHLRLFHTLTLWQTRVQLYSSLKTRISWSLLAIITSNTTMTLRCCQSTMVVILNWQRVFSQSTNTDRFCLIRVRKLITSRRCCNHPPQTSQLFQIQLVVLTAKCTSWPISASMACAYNHKDWPKRIKNRSIRGTRKRSFEILLTGAKLRHSSSCRERTHRKHLTVITAISIKTWWQRCRNMQVPSLTGGFKKLSLEATKNVEMLAK